MNKALLWTVTGCFTLFLTPVTGQDDIEHLRLRFIAPYTGKKVNLQRIEALLKKQRDDGTWPDIDYHDKSRSPWNPQKHVERLRILAEASVSNSLKQKPELQQQIISALQRGFSFWYKTYPKSKNWWHNRIGAPDRIVKAFMLAGDKLLRELWKNIRNRCLKVCTISMTGQNRVWLAGIVLFRAILDHNQEAITKARNAIFEEVRQTTEEGIQYDWSFHQHGPQLQFGNYGLAYASRVSDWIRFFADTKFAIPPEKLAIIRNYILHGLAWPVWRGKMDLSSCGRQIYSNSQAGKARGVVGILKRTCDLDPEFKTEYTRQMKAITGEHTEDFQGTRHFWCSDYLVHRQRDWFASVRMSSTRVIGSESCNAENILGLHMGDGCLYVMKTGKEYENIQAVWDWHRLPGTTCDQGLTDLHPTRKRCLSPSDFAGGINFPQGGIAAMIYQREKLQARKSWFFLPDGVVCLGSAIHGTTRGRVLTSVEQSLSMGNHQVITSEGRIRNIIEKKIKQGDIVTNGDIRYHLLDVDQGAILENKRVKGDWQRIFHPHLGSRPLEKQVFSLAIDHGKNPHSGHYAYIIDPCGKKPEVELLHRDNRAHILRCGVNRFLGVFFEGASIELKDGSKICSSDGSIFCLELIGNNRFHLWLADPRQKLKSLQMSFRLHVSGLTETVDDSFPLPSGPYAGST
ncbi:MAG: hypothetical protein D6820_10380, partial [Lentisphaerae bacterium]